MDTRIWSFMVGLSLVASSTASGQVVSGVMTVTGAEMHWWGGVARDATARLYDVEDSSVVYTKPDRRGKYDHGTIAFKARKGKLIDLDKLHESIWATRLSGGTSSGLVRLDVTAVGEVTVDGNSTMLMVPGSKKAFVLVNDPKAKKGSKQQTAFAKVRAAIDNGEHVSITGQIEGWGGRWPQVLSKRPASPRRIIVSGFAKVEKE